MSNTKRGVSNTDRGVSDRDRGVSTTDGGVSDTHSVLEKLVPAAMDDLWNLFLPLANNHSAQVDAVAALEEATEHLFSLSLSRSVSLSVSSSLSLSLSPLSGNL